MEKQQVFYIHGGSSFGNYDNYLADLRNKTLRYPEGNKPDLWPKALRRSLPDCQVFAPEMPNSANARYEEWKIWFERHFEYIHDGAVLVGWSLGAMFLQKYLLEAKPTFTISALILVAPPVHYFKDEESGEDGGDFNFEVENVGRLAEELAQIHIFHSKDDYVVPYEHALELKAALPAATLHTFEDRNHFLQPEFPELIALIKELGAQ